MNAAILALLDRHTVHDVVTRLFVEVDERDWDGVRSCLASRVRFDMSSAGAGPARVRTADEIVRDWRATLEPVERVHHQIGSVVVDLRPGQDEAEVKCHGLAFHRRDEIDGPETRMYAGRYTFRLCQEGHKWKIGGIHLDLHFVEGGSALETLPM